MQEIRETVAEAIHEAKMAHQVAKGAEIQEASATATWQTVHAHSINTTTSAEQSRERGEPEMGRTPLHRLQDALRRRFGSENLRTSTSRAETTGGGANGQRR